MSKRERVDTFRKIDAKYEQWDTIRTPPQASERAYAIQHLRGGGMSKLVLAAIGIGTGILLLILAGVAFYTSAYWWGFGRDGAGTGYAIVGVFLVIAGIGASLSTWNHVFRVLDPNRAPAAHH